MFGIIVLTSSDYGKVMKLCHDDNIDVDKYITQSDLYQVQFLKHIQL